MHCAVVKAGGVPHLDVILRNKQSESRQSPVPTQIRAELIPLVIFRGFRSLMRPLDRLVQGASFFKDNGAQRIFKLEGIELCYLSLGLHFVFWFRFQRT